MRLRRKILIGIGTALALLLLFLALLPSLIDLDRYRDTIAARAEKALGRKVSLAHLKLSFLKPVAFVQGIRIAERSGFGEGPFLEAEALEVRIELLPLLIGQVKIAKAVLDRPRIVIARSKTGSWNIDDLLKQPSAVSSQPSGGDQKSETRDHRSKAPVPRSPSPVPFLPALSLPELEVRRGKLIFLRTEAGGASISQIADFSLKVSQPSLDAPLTFRLSAVLPPFKEEGMEGGTIELDGKVDPKPVLSGVEGAEGFPLDVTLTVRGLGASFLKSYLGLEAIASPERGGLDLAGSLDMELKVHGPWGQLGLEGVLDLNRLKVAYAGVLKGEGEPGKLKVKGRQKGEGLVFDQVSLDIKGLKLSGHMRLAALKHPKVQFFLSSPSLDLDQLRAGPPPSPHPSPLRGEGQGRGGIAWASLKTEEQKLPSQALQPDIWHPTSSIPSGFSADGKIQVAHLRVSGLTFQNLTSDVLYNQAVLRLRRLTASLDGGRLWADLKIDLSRKYPSLALSSHLEGVKTGPLLQALKEPAWSLDGILSLRSTLTFQGPTPWGLGTASGRGSLIIEKGRFKGPKSFDRFVEAFASFLRSEGGKSRLQEFDRLQGEFTLEKGFVRTKDLTLSKEGWQLLAMGTLGLLDSSLDFDLVAKLPRATLTAKLSGTTAEPLVVPKGGRLRRRVETELSKRKGLKNLLKELFQ